ncbi:hypothetical protein H5410_035331 [Solanum commersonii]|uniref:Uncharacterized protein n=1 Tax=Solanum commersonii TaxID=4109 RepID=A0A9J5Y0C4_SOLCO|nr:hypothetical protein H5410_035331 [Solanum commersonii]
MEKGEAQMCCFVVLLSDMVKTQVFIFAQLSSWHSINAPAGNRTRLSNVEYGIKIRVDSISATSKDDPSYESYKNITINVPTIVVHFINADLELSPSSTFAEVEEGLVCLTILPADEITIFGNLA